MKVKFKKASDLVKGDRAFLFRRSTETYDWVDVQFVSESPDSAPNRTLVESTKLEYFAVASDSMVVVAYDEDNEAIAP